MESIKEKATALVRNWADDTSSLPGIRAAWVFGSLAQGDFGPGSDIDLQMALDENALEGAWSGPRSDFTKAFGPHLVAERRDGLQRIITEMGFVVDLGAERWNGNSIHRTSRYPIELLYARCPCEGVEIEDGRPRSFPERDAIYGPKPEELQDWLAQTLAVMLAAPRVQDKQAARALYFSLYHVELAKLAYRLEQVAWAVGYKHIDEWMAPDVLARLDVPTASLYELFRRMLGVLGNLFLLHSVEWPQAIVDSCWSRFEAEIRA